MSSKCSYILTALLLAFPFAIRLTAAQQESSMPMNMPMISSAPLVIQSSDWDSSVTIVNESKNRAHAQLALRLKDGTPAGSQMVTLPGHSSRRVTVASLLNAASEDFIGSLTLTVQEANIAKNMAVAAQLTLLDKSSVNGARQGSICRE